MKKILIVEDEKALARVMSLKLNSAGYSTSVVFSGEESLAVLSKESFDLIILDLVMPKKDGFFVLSEISRQGIKTPVIVASNLSQKEDIEKAKKLGAVDYFIKSDVTLVEIVNKVKQHLQ
ncbi:MAG: response regulator [Candidatus Daviesbacteria bacterium]|nr:response regulator [Candidatus Daviesbacteria bacterium]